jgi:hypothetical protein
MATLQQMLAEVGISELPDVENALAYCAIVTQDYTNLVNSFPSHNIAAQVGQSSLEFLIETYETQFAEMVDAQVSEVDLSFSKVLAKNGITGWTNESEIMTFFNSFVHTVLSVSTEILGKRPQTIAIVLISLRKILEIIKAANG